MKDKHLHHAIRKNRLAITSFQVLWNEDVASPCSDSTLGQMARVTLHKGYFWDTYFQLFLCQARGSETGSGIPQQPSFCVSWWFCQHLVASWSFPPWMPAGKSSKYAFQFGSCTLRINYCNILPIPFWYEQKWWKHSLLTRINYARVFLFAVLLHLVFCYEAFDLLDLLRQRLLVPIIEVGLSPL